MFITALFTVARTCKEPRWPSTDEWIRRHNFSIYYVHIYKEIFSSVAQSCPTLWPHELQHARPPCPSQSRSWLTLMPIQSMMPSSHLILCCPLLLLLPIAPSIMVFPSESTLRMRWPKYWSFSFSISPSNEYLGLISFRMEWLDLLSVQEIPKSVLQYHSSKASILQHSAFLSPTLTFITWPLEKP